MTAYRFNLLLFLIIGSVVARSSGAQTALSPESQIQKILSAQEVAWNVGDSVSWGSAFTDDADFINILGQVFHGRQTIVQVHARVFAGPYQSSHTTITVKQFKQISPDVVLVETVHELTGYKSLPPGITPTATGVLRTRMKYVAIKREDSWQFTAAQNTAILPDSSTDQR
jgi:uncharacterized protein (TIGR02246 family)